MVAVAELRQEQLVIRKVRRGRVKRAGAWLLYQVALVLSSPRLLVVEIGRSGGGVVGVRLERVR